MQNMAKLFVMCTVAVFIYRGFSDCFYVLKNAKNIGNFSVGFQRLHQRESD